MDLSADRLVIGENLNGGGVAWVYERTGPGATFGPPTKLTASDSGTGNQFGASVAIDGDTIAVGDFAAQKPNFPARDGAAYVFQYDGVDWIETDLLRADDGFDGEGFGNSVALSGTDLVVGAPNDTNSNGDAAGAIYTYDVAALPPTPANLTFELGLGTGSGPVTTPSGIAVSEFNREPLSGGTASGNVAASPITAIGVEDTAIASITLGATPLRAIVADSPELQRIPLTNISIDTPGGWSAIIAGDPALEAEPFASLTFGQVLEADTLVDGESPSGRLAAVPLRADRCRRHPVAGDSRCRDRPRRDPAARHSAPCDR